MAEQWGGGVLRSPLGPQWRLRTEEPPQLYVYLSAPDPWSRDASWQCIDMELRCVGRAVQVSEGGPKGRAMGG